MDINLHVTINAPGIVEALNNFALAMTPGRAFAAPECSGAAAPVMDAKPNRSSKKAKADETKKPADQEPSAPKVESAPEPAAAAAETPAEKAEEAAAVAPSDAELLAAAKQKASESPETKAAIKALLVAYGSKAVSEVPKDKRAAFLEELQGL